MNGWAMYSSSGIQRASSSSDSCMLRQEPVRPFTSELGTAHHRVAAAPAANDAMLHTQVYIPHVWYPHLRHHLVLPWLWLEPHNNEEVTLRAQKVLHLL
jgi:hypothetical protein